MKRLAPLALALAALLAPASAGAAPPNPFGHACTPQNGVLFCPTSSDAERVPSFDGVPIDVDVTLPPTGDGPFPAIVMMHGWGGNKTGFQSATPEGNGGSTYRYNNVYYAQRGYAVINPSARGFGRSCGAPDSRTAPACDRGWIHLSDHRYEGRDIQHLLGLLVDQNVVMPSRIGVTGISYGGIQSLNLARLRGRIRLTNGSFAAWRSPGGVRLQIRAAWARWAGSDLTTSLTPNGRFLDFQPTFPNPSSQPLGVMKRSYVNGLYASGNAAGFIAPAGADPTADLTNWRALTDAGEPYPAAGRAVARELTEFHSAAGLPGQSAPLLVQNGWTDDLFPAPEGLRVYNTAPRGSRVSLQFGDLGHPRGSNKTGADRVFNQQGSDFFDAWLRGRPGAPKHGSVTAFTQTCPKDAPAGGPFQARSWERLHPGRFRLSARRPQRVASGSGNEESADAFDPIGGDADGACAAVPRRTYPGTAVAERAVRRPFTLLGLPTVRATIDTNGRGGLLVARLYDARRGRETLISRGVYRLTDNQSGRIVFQLFGNGWRYRRGHSVKLELLGNDPDFVRTSNNRFSVRVSRLKVELPTR